MRVLVIGGTRFIGPHVVRLLAKDHDVACFHRGRNSVRLPDSAPVREILGDRKNLPVDELRAFKPDVVLDMIAMTEADAAGLVRAFPGKRLVSVSSCDVYRAYGRLLRTEPGEPVPVPLTEDSPLREKLFPLKGAFPGGDDYDKILVERAILGAGGTILRLPMVYGPGDGQHRTRPYLRRMDDKRPAIILDQALAAWKTSWGFVENVAAWIAKVVVDPRAAGRIYNLADIALTTSEWVSLIGTAAGWSGRLVTLPQSRLPASLTEDIDARQDLVVDATRIRELGDIAAIPLDEALRRTVAWERSNPPASEPPLDYAAEDLLLSAS